MLHHGNAMEQAMKNNLSINYHLKIIIMKRIYYVLLLVAVSFTACKKDGTNADAKGTLTAKMSFYDAGTSKWSPNEDFIATSVVTTKAGADYTIKATDAGKNSFTLNIKNVSGAGVYKVVNTSLVKGGKTLNATSGIVTVTTATDKSLTATFIFEDGAWSVFDGKVSATF